MDSDEAPPLRQAPSTDGGRAIAIVDEQGTVTGWSRDAERLLACGAEEILGHRADELFLWTAGSPFWTLPLGQDDWQGELSARCGDGRPLRLQGMGRRFSDRDGRSQWVLLMSVPGQLLPQEIGAALLDWLLTRSPIAVTVFDTDLRQVQQNSAMTQLTGASQADRQGKRLSQALPGLHAEAWERRMRQVIATGEPAFDEELHGRVPADPHREHVFSASASTLQDSYGQVLGLCATVTDVTNRHKARERLIILNEASTRIGTTLDVMHTAQELADVAVPRIADLASVDLLETLLNGDEPGPFTGSVALRRVANQSAFDLAPELIHRPGDVDIYPADSPPVRCMATGRSALLRLADTEVRSWLTEDPERAARLQKYALQSIMGVPVRARGMTLGIAIFYRRSADPFTDEDRLLAEELVARAAVCLDNARRFTRERTTALALQHSVLPQRGHAQAAVRTASRYLPAGGQSGLGGDWFDVIPLSGARVGLVVGDVVGHGITAAATMGRLRTAVRTLSDVDLPPDELLTHLDDLVAHLSEEREDPDNDAAELGATCLYAIYDPVSRRCSMACAGHPPPAVVTPDGAVELLELAPGPPLGLGYLPFEPSVITLPEGSLLVLYTDGLVDSRTGDDGYERLQRALTKPVPSPEALCDSVLEDLLPDQVLDDVALLIACTRALDVDQVASLDIPAEEAAVAKARAWVTRQLASWELEAADFVTELVVSELVTNAIKYGHAPIQLRLIRDRTLICEVSDASNTAPHMRRARLFDEGGRGLQMVAQLTQRWGTRQTREGKTIWCEQLNPEGEPV
ncbi:hypothetical protein GCM10010377_68220 [Streptomyces viridiviolaceus]|uniref:SpoIIE family protein phosphatase n=1 Tax=Streptomyces viridiviolaceus TaxID=68282 RepID=A0ABW2E9S7_9ACTN|nr:SpoIIE family protein phosphatase [Streptomyces viridiviolaceus]GHB67684.1 hypothetical protein GCM10010377_68220 [Streptomyces viridiviolaceus]